MKEDVLKQSIRNKKIISFLYDGEQRLVCPTKLGTLTNHVKVLEAYTIGGYSKSGHIPDWRIYYLENIKKLEATEKTFHRPPGYNPQDPRFLLIDEQI